MKESGALLSAILRITHPDLYRAGRESLVQMAQHPVVAGALATWPTVFNMVQIVSNRETPYHRDTAGCPEWYDLLTSLGNHRHAFLSLRNLGMQVSYNPGTVVLLCSLIVHHGVARADADRICYSWFMCKAVHMNHGVRRVDWMDRSSYVSPSL